MSISNKASLCRPMSMDDMETWFKDEDEISIIKKDLRTYLTGCSKQHRQFFKETQFMTNPAVNDVVHRDLYQAWGAMAMRIVYRELGSKRKKKIDGIDWNVGWHGSVWKDMTILEVPVRICYYSRKMNEEQMKNVSADKQWVIMLDPHSIDTFQPSKDETMSDED